VNIQVGQRALKIAERRAVDVMDDDGHAGAPGGQPAENARLAAVRVDNIRFLLAQDFFELSKGDEIFQRLNRADEFGNAGEQSGDFGRLHFSEPSGPIGRAGNQLHFDAGFCAQPQDGGQGVFLRAADDEPGDDVGDAHGVICRPTASGVRGRL
jgi:hypothetical protein